VTHVHHSAIHAKDVDASLRFYRDGLGLQVLMDHEFDGDWRALFDAPADRLRSVFLGNPATPDAGIVELVAFDCAGADDPDASLSEARRAGFFLLSFFVDVDETLGRLGELGFDAPVSRIRVPGPEGDVEMATVRDPDGVLVELVGARRSRETLGLGT
jgi:catechol 2,3-dioxygenase-like lactoylglutathione lyase family enzyme